MLAIAYFSLAMELIIVAILTTVVIAGSDLTTLDGSGNSSIGKTFKLGYANLISNTNTYCIQKNKNMLTIQVYL